MASVSARSTAFAPRRRLSRRIVLRSVRPMVAHQRKAANHVHFVIRVAQVKHFCGRHHTASFTGTIGVKRKGPAIRFQVLIVPMATVSSSASSSEK